MTWEVLIFFDDVEEFEQHRNYLINEGILETTLKLPSFIFICSVFFSNSYFENPFHLDFKMY